MIAQYPAVELSQTLLELIALPAVELSLKVDVVSVHTLIGPDICAFGDIEILIGAAEPLDPEPGHKSDLST